MADIKSERRPASDWNRWPASYWNAWPASSVSADYALAEAKRTKFDVQSLGGVRQYLASYLSGKAARRAMKKAEVKASQERQADDKRAAYEVYRRAQARRIFMTLPRAERNAIEKAATAQSASFAGSLRKIMFERKRDHITAQRHSSEIETIGQWRAAH